MGKGKRVQKGFSARRVILLVLMAIFLFSSGNLIYHLIEYRQGEETYREAENLVQLPDFSDFPTPAPVPMATSIPTVPPSLGESGIPQPSESVEPTPTPTPYTDPYADALSAMDFTALREANPEVIGWILIPGTTVSYPLLQGEDNEYYLNHTWKGRWSSVGAIFMECRNSPDLTDFHTIVYGHNMRNGSMFGALQSYRDQSFLTEHPSVYLTVDSGTYRYDIFSIYQAEVDSNTYQLGFPREGARETFLADCAGRSVIETGVTPQTYDRILTLSTCTNIGGKNIRWVVQAALPGGLPLRRRKAKFPGSPYSPGRQSPLERLLTRRLRRSPPPRGRVFPRRQTRLGVRSQRGRVRLPAENKVWLEKKERGLTIELACAILRELDYAN